MLEKIYFARTKETPEGYDKEKVGRDYIVIPSKEDEDAGYDIYACFDEDYMILNPQTTTMIPSGIASAIEVGYYAQLEERGSTGTKGMAQRCGVIDSGYRGEWLVPITNVNQHSIVIYKKGRKPTIEQMLSEEALELYNSYEGFRNSINSTIFYPYEKAIAQAIIQRYESPKVEELTFEILKRIPSKRGDGKLGSSGK